MEFVDDFQKKMTEIKDGHLKRMSDLYTKIAETNKNITDHEEMADFYLSLADVENTVKNRILKEKYEKELEVYQDLLKNENTSVVITGSEYRNYMQQIFDEYRPREYSAYVNLLNRIESVKDAIKQIDMLDAEAHTCYDYLIMAVNSSSHGIDYKKEYGNPFQWGFSISRFITEPLSDGTPVSMIKSKIKELEPYANAEEADDE